MMNLDRLQTIINAYGNDAARWPADERQAALTFINKSSAARQVLQASVATSEELDAWLDSDMFLDSPEFEQIKHRIGQRATARILDRVIKIPADSNLERFFTWLLPDPTSRSISFWKPGLVASLPLVLGMVLGSLTETGIRLDSTGAEDALVENQAWDEELYLLALTDQMPRQWSGDWTEE